MRILRYFAGTTNLGLTYRKSADNQEANKLNASADADHAGADDRRSVSGWCVMLNGAMISWASKRQPVTAISNTESEFYAHILARYVHISYSRSQNVSQSQAH